MAIDPAEIAVGAWYRTEGGEDRMVWAIRDGTACYFSRSGPDQPWVDSAPGYQNMPVAEFAAQANPVQPPGADQPPASKDSYGAGDW